MSSCNCITVYCGKCVRMTAEYNPVDGDMVDTELQPRELSLYPDERLKIGEQVFYYEYSVNRLAR